MASNFDFLESVDNELYSNIEEAQKLFRDEYFNQAMIQIRIFAEKMSKKILNSSDDLTFDDTLNCLKDKIKTEKEREFIEDLFFIKREGNKCAHGEDATAITVLEAIKRAFEASINYAAAKEKSTKYAKLNFDETLLITTKPLSQNSIVEKYVKLADEKQKELLETKQQEFEAAAKEKTAKTKKQPNPEKQRIKEKIKKAKKNLSQNVNKIQKKKKGKKQDKSKMYKAICFILFVIISLIFLTKMIFIF